jgi:hypothetical protein
VVVGLMVAAQFRIFGSVLSCGCARCSCPRKTPRPDPQIGLCGQDCESPLKLYAPHFHHNLKSQTATSTTSTTGHSIASTTSIAHTLLQSWRRGPTPRPTRSLVDVSIALDLD